LSGIRWLLPCLLLVCALAARAKPSVFLEDLTSPELRELIRAGTTTIIVPAGGTEQNGPHMTLGKHNARVHLLAGKIAAAVGHTVVAPVLAYVPEGRIALPEAHMRFVGTISIPPEVFRATLEAAARSFKQHGFKDIVFIGDHGGTQADLDAVARQLNRAWAGSGVRAHYLGVYYRAARIDSHAGSADTALQLALAPETVRSNQLARAAREGAAGGTVGDPQAATVAKGQTSVDLVVAQSVAALRTALAAPRP
jgi:creatinine amidohydrolase